MVVALGFRLVDVEALVAADLVAAVPRFVGAPADA